MMTTSTFVLYLFLTFCIMSIHHTQHRSEVPLRLLEAEYAIFAHFSYAN